MSDDIYTFEAKLLDGRTRQLSDYRDRVLLIVNTASKCVLTSQYRSLQLLHERFADRGLSILGFPCNQFRQQEPGDAPEIGEFCQRNYGVDFDMFAKIDVNGETSHPLFRYLKAAAPGWFGRERIAWNFNKFLIGRGGEPIERYGPGYPPSLLAKQIERLLRSEGLTG